ncbi:amidohydrolase family protein [Candidimonas nitroreducens]|uniref:Amidohydrolase n=1 Tax=Candidimonas nitroreducens TaxID=683354 RepID=A0A225MYJ0_9BURK|nr:amidohydrolase family protein [Candidimonas nitroreducens]OWT63759.1 amidohydrolase [Candidimonas nitroreducens]
MYIDFSSKPPTPEFQDQGSHMANYNHVYERSKSAVASARESSDATLLAQYLDVYEHTGAKHVILKGRDLESTYGFKVSNEDVAAFCMQHGPRYIGYAGIDPHKGMAAVRDLEHAVKNLGMRGCNLPCFELKLAINDPRMYPIYAKCIELNIPAVVHCGVNFSTTSPIRNSHPQLLDDVMVHFPELRVIAAPPGWPWVQELISVAWRHRNVYIALAAVRPKYLATPNSGYESLLQYGTTVLKDRVIFGSAFPLMPVTQALDDIQALPMSDEIRCKWLHDNAVRALGLV